MISGQNEICLSHNPLHHPMNHSIELDSTYLLLSTKEEWRYDIIIVRYGNLDIWFNLPRLYPPRFYQPRYNLGRFYLHRYYPS